MESILLDTNVISELMRPQPDQAVMDWFAKRTGNHFFISAITQAEIMLGISLLPAGKRKETLRLSAEAMFSQEFGGKCLPFDTHCVPHYAALVAHKRKAGLTVATEDAQIAAIALAYGYPVATRNTKDFLKISGLTLYNPWQK